jgi:hypothetical protein
LYQDETLSRYAKSEEREKLVTSCVMATRS